MHAPPLAPRAEVLLTWQNDSHAHVVPEVGRLLVGLLRVPGAVLGGLGAVGVSGRVEEPALGVVPDELFAPDGDALAELVELGRVTPSSLACPAGLLEVQAEFL